MIPKTKQIFISFANEARETADKIASALRINGFDVWIYYDKMKAGQNWEKVQKIAMEESSHCICIFSKAVLKDKGRERVVWKEINYAIERTEENSVFENYFIPVTVNIESLPDEIKELHAIDYDRDGIEAILKAVRIKEEKPTPKLPQANPLKITKPQANQHESDNPLNKGRILKRLSLLIFATILIIFGLYFITNWQNSTQQSTTSKARFQTQVIDKYTHLPVKDVTAYILNKNKNDTIAISDPSGSDGRVYFELDTSQRITISVNFRQKAYEDDRVLYELPSSLVLPQFALTPKVKPDSIRKKTNASQQQVGVKYFSVSGFTLTIEQRKQIERSCSYVYQENQGIKFSYDYNHDNFGCIESGCRFKGSDVKLSGNGFSAVIGKPLAPSPAIALPKNEWEAKIKAELEQHAAENQEQIFQLIKQWLCAS